MVDITRILIGYVLSDACFDWLVGNISAYQENVNRSRSKQTAFFFICRIIFEKYFNEAMEVFFSMFAYPHPNTRGVGGILVSYANPRIRFA